MKTSHALDAMYKVMTAKGNQYNKISTDATGAFQNNFHSTFSNNPMHLQYRNLGNHPSFFSSTAKVPPNKKITSNLQKYSLTAEACSHDSEFEVTVENLLM